MFILTSLLKIILNFIYFFLKLLPQKNKIVFISRESNKPSKNFLMIKENILSKNKDIEIVMLCKRLNNGFSNKLKYSMHMLPQMYHLATSKVVILDTYCITVSILKHKKNLKVIQLWHAMGTLKKFAYSILGKDEGRDIKVSKYMNMHKNYNYVLASSKNCIGPFSEAFNTPKENFFTCPLPIVDNIINNDYKDNIVKKIYNKYPKINNKKQTILYCPTFRKNNYSNNKANIYKLINSIDYDKYNLIIKLHPISKMKIDDDRVVIDRNFYTFEIGFISDFIITDYSAVVFELSLLNKPLFFYTFDYDLYINKRDFYIDYKKEMPGLISSDSKDIIESIENKTYKINKVKSFSKKYITIPKEGSTNKIVNLILELIK